MTDKNSEPQPPQKPKPPPKPAIPKKPSYETRSTQGARRKDIERLREK